jgi:phosphatidylethanolamine/phosphatidyl-N-methylethanolamine N-methyltransferase
VTTTSPRNYNFIAPVYDHVFSKPLSEGHQKIGNLMRKLRTPGKKCKILEVGVGSGLTLGYLPGDVDYLGIDVSERMLSIAQTKIKKSKHKEIKLAVMNAERMSLASDTFDLVLAPSVLSAMADPMKGLKEIIRVTKKKGKIAIIVNLRKKDSFKSDVVKSFDPFTRKFLGFRLDIYAEDFQKFKNVKILEMKEVNSLFGQSLSTYVLMEKL